MAELGLETGKVEEYTKDGTVDLKGNPVLRSKRGGWTACSFVVGKIDIYICIYCIYTPFIYALIYLLKRIYY